MFAKLLAVGCCQSMNLLLPVSEVGITGHTNTEKHQPLLKLNIYEVTIVDFNNCFVLTSAVFGTEINSLIRRPTGCWHRVIFECMCWCTVLKSETRCFTEHHLGAAKSQLH
jgi:hypothetical protein